MRGTALLAQIKLAMSFLDSDAGRATFLPRTPESPKEESEHDDGGSAEEEEDDDESSEDGKDDEDSDHGEHSSHSSVSVYHNAKDLTDLACLLCDSCRAYRQGSCCEQKFQLTYLDKDTDRTVHITASALVAGSLIIRFEVDGERCGVWVTRRAETTPQMVMRRFFMMALVKRARIDEFVTEYEQK